MGAHAGGADESTQRSVASALNLTVARLAQDGEVAGEQVRPVACEPAEPVEIGVDLLVVVPHPRDVHRGLGQLNGELELHRHTGLHVDRAATPRESFSPSITMSRVGRLSLIGTVSM